MFYNDKHQIYWNLLYNEMVLSEMSSLHEENYKQSGPNQNNEVHHCTTATY